MPDDKDRKDQVKDNTGRDFKPRDASRGDRAPRGHLGTAPSLGLGSASVNRPSQEALTATKPERTKEKSPDANEKSMNFRETGDQEVDRFYSKSHKMTGKSDNEKDPSDDRER